MKKLISVLLIALIAVMLTGCGDKKIFEEAVGLIEKGEYAQAKGVFESIPDYEGTDAYLAKYVDIEITEENWDRYFEIVEVPVWETNAFDEGELFCITFVVQLKEEYEPFLLGADVAMEFEYKEPTYVIEIDGPNFSYVVTDVMPYGDDADTRTNVVSFDYNDPDTGLRKVDHCEVYHNDEEDFWYVYYMTDAKLLRVKGNISIYAE